MFGKKIFFKKKVLIYGLGLSGKSCLKFLKKNNTITIFDDFKTHNNNKSFCYNVNTVKNKKFDFIVLSPGIDIKNCKLSKYLKKNQKKIITELDIFYLMFPKNLKITITGTNGKSTSCQIIYEILKSKNLDVRLVGNIGKPPLLEKKIKPKTIFIIEASSYQISYSKYFKTDYAAILNLSPDHLERHGNINKYAMAKLKLIYNQDKKAYSYIEKYNSIINKNILKESIKSKLYKINYNKIKFFKNKIKNLYLLDKNNLENIHFIYNICKKLKFTDKLIFRSLNKFKGLKFRKQIIYNKGNLKIINDSKSTSFSSTIGLLYTYKNIYWIVGGMFKKADKFNLEAKYYSNISAYVIGSNKNNFKNIFRKKIKFKYLVTLKKALLQIRIDMKKNSSKKTILFSPAAASFDQFKNFEERGEYFNKIVDKLIIKNQ